MMLLRKYVLKETVKTFVLAMIVFTAVMFLGNMFHETRHLQNVGPEYMLYLLPLILPDAMVRVIPLSLLIAVSLVFGRMSVDNEINAMQSSGVNLKIIIVPVLIFALFVSAFTVKLNKDMVPDARYRKKDLRHISFKMLISGSTLGTAPFRLANYRISYSYSENGIFHDIRGVSLMPDGGIEFFSGEKGKFEIDERNSTLKFTLENGIIEVRSAESSGSITSGKFKSWVFDIDADEVLSVKQKRLIEMTASEIENFAAAHDYQRYSKGMIYTERHKRLPWGMCTFFFCFVGIPVGIFTRKGGIASGLGTAVVLGVVIYFPMMMMFEALGKSGAFMPLVAVWLPNAVFFAAGSIMYWKMLKR